MNLYRTLLMACPSSFRHEYGREMEAVFRGRLRDGSPAARIGWWLAAPVDVLITAAGAHWDLLRQDLRYAFRSAQKAPGFTLAAIAVAALGIAAATAVFSVADHVLLRALPFPEPERLVKLWQRTPEYSRMDVSPANYRDWKAASRSFEAMAAFRALSVNASDRGEPERLDGAAVNYELFSLLGIQPLIGRVLIAADDATGAASSVILSYGFWQRRFGGDPSVVGQQMRLNDEVATIVGVMPPNFHFPRREVQIWTAMRFEEDDFSDRQNCYLGIVARLKPGLSMEQAKAEVNVIGANLEKAYPNTNAGTGVAMLGLRDEVSTRSRTTLMVLVAAAFFVVLIACANLANLLAARSASRRREMEVRTALGAGRDRLVRQLLTESVLLSGAGGAIGMFLAVLVIPLLSRLAPTTLPIAGTPQVDWRVLSFAALTAIMTGIAFGIAPAFRSSSITLNLRTGGGIRRERMRRVLVAVQVGASLALVIATGLLGRALLRLEARDPGFTTDHVLAFRTSLPMPKYLDTAPRERFYTTVMESVRALPGVQSVAVTSFRPMGDFRGGIWKLIIAGEVRETHASARFVTPGYFSTMKVPLIRGRDFRLTDKPETERVAIVSESFVKDHWPGESGLGRHFGIPFGDLSFTIVGVAGDVRFRGLEGQSEPQMYFAHAQMPDKSFVWFAPKDFVVASSVSPESLVPEIRRIVAQVDPQQPVSDVQTLAALVREETATRRTQLWVILSFSAAALLLAGVGIHGLLAFAVAQRSQEIGVRRALGAQSSSIASLVLVEAIALSLAGSAVGATAAVWLGGSMKALLAGVPPADTVTLASSIGLVLLMSACGVILPLVRALRVDPAVALRAD